MIVITAGGVVLDLYENESINLNFESAILQSLDGVSSSYSQTFRIPASSNNVDLFGDFFNPNLVNGFNPKLKVDATIAINSTVIIEGYLQLKNVYKQKERYHDFEVIIYGETSALSKAIGDKKLADLNLSDLEEEINVVNVTSRWGAAYDELRYAIIDRGLNWTFEGQSGGTKLASIGSDGEPIYPSQFTPMVAVKRIIKQIFKEAGKFFSSDFFDNEGEKLYIPWISDGDYIKTQTNNRFRGFNVGCVTDFTVGVPYANQGIVADFYNASETAPFYDPGNYYTIVSPLESYFTAPFAGTFTFDVWATVYNVDYAPDVKMYVEDVVTGNKTFIGAITGLDPGTSNGYFADRTFTLNAGDKLKLSYLVWSQGNNDFKSSASPDINNGTGWKLKAASATVSGGLADLTANAPDMKQIDFLKSLASMFKLSFVPDNANKNAFVIEPFSDYLSGGDVVDWTSKLDNSKDIVLTPTADLQAKKLTFTYTEDVDYLNKNYKERGGRVYGSHVIDNSLNDFATADEKIECGFSPTPLEPIDGGSLIIPKMVNEKGEGIAPKPRILYFCGTYDCTTWTSANSPVGVVNEYTSYGAFSHYSELVPRVEVLDLNFGKETPQHIYVTQANNTLVERFWKPYLTEIYSDEARIMTAYFNLDLLDITGFKYSDNIFIKDSYWRINKISSFRADKREVTQVELVKIIYPVAPCAYTPSSSNGDGSVIFKDNATPPNYSSGNQTCCEEYGYLWDSINSVCLGAVRKTDTRKIAINSNSLSVANSGQNNKARNVITQGNVNIDPSSYNIVASGEAINIGQDVYNSIAIGKNIEVNAPNVAAFGQNVIADYPGLFYGFERLTPATGTMAGRSFELAMQATGSLSVAGNTITFYLQNSQYIKPPNGSTWMMNCNISLLAVNGVTYFSQALSYMVVVRTDAAGTHFIVNNIELGLHKQGQSINALIPVVTSNALGLTFQLKADLASPNPFPAGTSYALQVMKINEMQFTP